MPQQHKNAYMVEKIILTVLHIDHSDHVESATPMEVVETAGDLRRLLEPQYPVGDYDFFQMVCRLLKSAAHTEVDVAALPTPTPPAV